MTATTLRTFNPLKFLPLSQTGWIGVDIGTASIKIAQVERVGRRWQIANRLLIMAPQKDGPDATGFSHDWVESALRESNVASGFRGTQAACVLSQSACELRAVELPEASDSELREMLAQEFSEEGDFQDREFGYWETGQAGAADSGGLKQFSVLSVSNQLVDGIAHSLLHAGLRCEVMDGLPFALARAVRLASPAATSEPVAAIDWGFETATLTIVDGITPAFTRSMRNCGFRNLTDSLGKRLGITQEECRLLLGTYGLQTQNDTPQQSDLQYVITELASEAVNCVVDELKRTLSYLRQQKAALAPKQLWLFGGGATIRNIAETLAPRIDLPVSIWKLAESGQHPNTPVDPSIALFGPAAALSVLGGKQP